MPYFPREKYVNFIKSETYNFTEFEVSFKEGFKKLSIKEIESLSYIAKFNLRDDIVEYLDKIILEKEVNNPSKKRSIEYLSFRGELELVKQRIEENERAGEDIDRNAPYLIYGAASTNLELVEYLISKGINIDVKNQDGYRALLVASEIGNIEVVRILANHGVDFNVQDHNKFSALHIASIGGHLDLVKYLVKEKGLDVASRNYHGETVLFSAAYNGQVDVVRYLAEECGVDIEARNHDSYTPLIGSCRKSSCLEVVRYLVSKGADIQAKNHSNETALHEASYYGATEIVKYLIEECGVDIEVRNNNNDTALILASFQNKLDLVKYLLDKGANIHAISNLGVDAMVIAACEGHLEVLKYLVEHGANVFQINKVGFSPLFEPVYRGNLEVVKYLVSQGVDINHKDNKSKSVFDMDIKENIIEIRRVLQENKDLVVFRKMEYFSVERNFPVPVNLLKKALSNKNYKREIKSHKEEFKKFLELHGNAQILDENSRARFISIMNDEFSIVDDGFSKVFCKLISNISNDSKFSPVSELRYCNAISLLVDKYGYEWLVANGFEGGREKLSLIVGVNKYFGSNNKALPYSIDVIDNIRHKLSKAIDGRKKISIDNKVKEVILSILGNISEDVRCEVDSKIITRLEAEREFEGLVEEVERVKKDISSEIKLYNNFVNKVGSTSGFKMRSKVGAQTLDRGEDANSGESPKQLFQKNITDKLNELLLDLIKLSNIGEAKIVKESIDWIGLNVIKGELKQFTENKFREEAKLAKSKFSVAVNNLVRHISGENISSASLEELENQVTKSLELFCLSCSKLRMVLKNDVHNKDIEGFIDRITRCEENIEGELEGIFEYFAGVKQNLSSIYLYSDSDLLLAEVEERYGIGAGVGYGSGFSIMGEEASIGLGTYLGGMSLVGSVAGSMVGLDSRDRDDVVFKDEVDGGDEDSKNEELDQVSQEEEQAREVQLSGKLESVLYKLKNPTSRGNFSKHDMEILKSNFPGQVVQIKTSNGFMMKVFSDGNILGITSTHKIHGSKASGFNGDYNIKFLNELSDLLEEASIYKKAGILEEEPSFGEATGYSDEFLASIEASTDEIIEAAISATIGASGFVDDADLGFHAGAAAGGPSVGISGHSSHSTSMSDLD